MVQDLKLEGKNQTNLSTSSQPIQYLKDASQGIPSLLTERSLKSIFPTTGNKFRYNFNSENKLL